MEYHRLIMRGLPETGERQIYKILFALIAHSAISQWMVPQPAYHHTPKTSHQQFPRPIILPGDGAIENFQAVPVVKGLTFAKVGDLSLAAFCQRCQAPMIYLVR